MRKLFTTAMMALAAIVATFAQTANNDPVTISWAMTSGTITEAPTYVPATMSQFIEKAEITYGSELTVTGAVTSDIDKITVTKFKQGSKNSASSDKNAVNFFFTLKDGIAFTPTKASVKVFRCNTDKYSVDVAWMSDGQKTPIASGQTPNRADGSKAAEASYFEKDLSGTAASEQQCGLRVNLYGANSGKEAAIGEVQIEGTFYGTVGQPLTYTLTLNVSPTEGGSIQAVPSSASYASGTAVTLLQQPAEGYIFTGWQTETGKVLTTADSYTFNIKGNSSIKATYVTKESLQVNDYVVVSTKDEFRAAIKQFNENPSSQRRFIFMKNGTYDYGTFVNTETDVNKNYGRDTIKVDNVSIIGQSTEGVTITITPTTSSVSRTSPIVIGSGTTSTYIQDLTVRNNFDYSGNDGQASTIMDKGDMTIMKNVKMLSNQDTYYPNTDMGRIYLENCYIEGTVDYVCGRGDVFLYKCTLNGKTRYPKNGEYSGGTDIAAPYTIVEDFNQQGGHGFIFESCYIDCHSQVWDYGRGWRGWPKMAFLNTVFSNDAKMRIGVDQTKGKTPDDKLRVGTKGIQTSSDAHATEFYEYNTMDEEGNVISPATNTLTFTACDSKTIETILKADEIDRFSLRNVFPSWAPDRECRQVEVTSATLEGNTMTWTTDQTAKAFLIEKGGEFVAIVDGTQNAYNVNGNDNDNYTVRAANMMGGFGVAKEATVATGIENVNGNGNAKEVVSTAYYSLSGSRLSVPQHGAYIVVKTMNDGTVIATKEMK